MDRLSGHHSEDLLLSGDQTQRVCSRLLHRSPIASTLCLLGVLFVLYVNVGMASAYRFDLSGRTAKLGPAVNDGPDRQYGTVDILQRLMGRGQRLKRTNTLEKKCLYQAELCDPWTDTCCPGMECLNTARGYCLPHFEPCICYPKTSSDIYLP